MTHYHAVLLDETRCEFGAGCEAESRGEAYEYFKEHYPESRVVQLEDDNDTREREARIQRQVEREYDDPYGYHYGDEDAD